MNITKDQADKVIAALESLTTIFSGVEDGITQSGTYQSDWAAMAIKDGQEALSIMRGLAEDADLLALFATSQKQLPLDAVISATPPQAQSSHAPNPSNINSLEAKTPDLVTPQAAPTEAQEREDFEAHWYNFYHAGHISADVDGKYRSSDVQKSWNAWKARAGRKG